MNWLAYTLFVLAAYLLGRWRSRDKAWADGYRTGHRRGCTDTLDALNQKQAEQWKRIMRRVRSCPRHRPDARPVEASTVDELVFRLVDDGDRLMEGDR